MEPEHLHSFPADPEILSPRHEARVLGHHVVLRWDAVDGVDAYRVEVARDTHFEDLVLSEETTGTSLDLSQAHFPADGHTYYWRVQSRHGDTYSRGEGIESFIAMKGSEIGDGPRTDPDEAEDKGPVPALLKAVGTEAAVEATGSETAKEAEAHQGVEHEGIEAGQILGFALALIVSVAAIAILMFNWTAIVRQEATDAAAAGVPGVSASAIRYPELYEAEMKARRATDHYEVLNDASGTYRIPVGEAINLMANEAATSSDSGRAAPGATSELPNLLGQ
jgi:hypothetical protein